MPSIFSYVRLLALRALSTLYLRSLPMYCRVVTPLLVVLVASSDILLRPPLMELPMTVSLVAILLIRSVRSSLVSTMNAIFSSSIVYSVWIGGVLRLTADTPRNSRPPPGQSSAYFLLFNTIMCGYTGLCVACPLTERLLGEEPAGTYVPLLLRPRVMDCARKESVHLGEKVTLILLQRYYWWIGMADSARWWIRRCFTCQSRKSA